jgi:RNA polymerase sigma factor (sigma-70 family)
VNSLTDQQLLRDYTGRRSEAAFAELVRRHVDFVHSAALRMVRDAHLAEDVTQSAFVALAQNARQLTDRPVLSGWLHRTAQNLAANAVRSDVRRRAREQEAAAMNELLSAEPDAVWEHIAPHLDAALGELSEPDRDALLLRYFERKSAREIALTLGVSDEAAQKRVSRAVERLREFFAKRGVTVGAGGLAVVISANAVQAAPVGLAITISTAAAIAEATLATTATATAIKTIAMTTLQKTLVTAVIVASVATPLVIQHQANVKLRNENRALRQQMEQQAKQADERLAQVQIDQGDMDRLHREHSELLRLRGEIGRQRTQVQPMKSPATALSNTGDTTPPASKLLKNDLPKDSWADVGFATPQAALQTRGWAVLNGNRERFKESVFITEGARKLVEDMIVKMASASTDPDKERLIQEALNNKWGVEEAVLMPLMALNQEKGFTGYRILSQESPSADEMILEVETQMASAPAKNETLKFRRFGNDWKMVIDEDAVKSER